MALVHAVVTNLDETSARPVAHPRLEEQPDEEGDHDDHPVEVDRPRPAGEAVQHDQPGAQQEDPVLLARHPGRFREAAVVAPVPEEGEEHDVRPRAHEHETGAREFLQIEERRTDEREDQQRVEVDQGEKISDHHHPLTCRRGLLQCHRDSFRNSRRIHHRQRSLI